MKWTEGYGSLAGRVLLATIFILSGITKIANFDATEAYMAQHGMGATGLLLTVAIIVELVGGFSILLGMMTQQGAVLLAAYLVPVTLIFHAFWAYSGMEQQAQLINFLKNLAIMGGLLYVGSRAVDRYTMDYRFHTVEWFRHRLDRVRRV